jgi:hypothetical protein
MICSKLARQHQRKASDMATTLEAIARNAACDAIAALHNGGTLEFQTAGSVEVATIGFSATAFGAATGGVATANTLTADTDATGGTTTKYVTKTSGAATILTGTVGTSGADIIIDNTVVSAGVTVDLTSYTITVPAS